MKRTSTGELCVNTIRMLSLDCVQRAKSGHPGLPLGAAPLAYVLWRKFMRFDGSEPAWPGRDRFVLSAGHGSALLYSILHLFGFEITLNDLKNFRQLHSKTPGHPEYNISCGCEATTGPLGQGFAMGVGMAIAERFMADRFNKPGFKIIDHHTYGIVSDGDLMEGISSESASLAGHLRLGKLIYLYDNNRITIDGGTNLAFTEDVCKRFESYGWQVIEVGDGNDLKKIETAIARARAEKKRPSLISVRTHIGFGSPRQDTAKVHGEPLGEDDYLATKKYFGWPLEKEFYIPKDASLEFDRAISAARAGKEKWESLYNRYKKSFSAEASLLESWLAGGLLSNWSEKIDRIEWPTDISTREALGKLVGLTGEILENLAGGSADLVSSTKARLVGKGEPRNIHFGVREHAMGGIINGMALHGGLIPFCSTFLIFSDYMRPSLRIAALMKARAIFIFSHDSIGLGEDGPTHQPIEHIMSLRAMPNLTVIRPADANETVSAWKVALEQDGPVAIILTRQKIPVIDTVAYPSAKTGLLRGAYILSETGKDPQIILIASGSEVTLALQVQKLLLNKGVDSRVVSMPSWEIFEKETLEYRRFVLPDEINKRVSIEAGATLGWQKYVGRHGLAIGIDHFGASAPGEQLMDEFGFSAEKILKRIIQEFPSLQRP